ncbi:MAG: Virion structural protein [uncultured bacterium]|nr:MAG: Virion structural protein [uncultured bacterium]
MKFSNFIQSLLPSFGKDRVLEDCRLTRAEIKEVTAPSYDAAMEFLKGWKFKSPEMEKLLSIFNRMVKGSGSDNAIVTIAKSFDAILKNLDHTEDRIAKLYNEDVAGAGITYQKANLLQFVECVGFVSKFARKFLIYTYICETAQYENSSTDIAESLSPAEIEWLNANFVSFCTAFNIVCGNPQTVEKQFAAVPDIVITSENAETLPSTIGDAKIDPFQMKLIPIVMNPIYHIGMFVAEWQASRYKAAKEELKLLQLRKLNLQKTSEGKPDAHLQQEIKYMETRIQGLNYKIAKMEKDNGK